MIDNRRLWFCGILLRYFTPLCPYIGILQGIIIGSRCDRSCLATHSYPCLVHHLEHVAQSFVRLSYQVCMAIFAFSHYQVSYRGSMISHFVEHPSCIHIIEG